MSDKQAAVLPKGSKRRLTPSDPRYQGAIRRSESDLVAMLATGRLYACLTHQTRPLVAAIEKIELTASAVKGRISRIETIPMGAGVYDGL